MDPSLGQSDTIGPQLEPFYYGRKVGFCALAQVSYKTGVCYQVYLLPTVTSGWKAGSWAGSLLPCLSSVWVHRLWIFFLQLPIHPV